MKLRRFEALKRGENSVVSVVCDPRGSHVKRHHYLVAHCLENINNMNTRGKNTAGVDLIV